METFIVECPECGIRIEVDKKTGKVINKYSKPNLSSTDPFTDMIKKTKEKNRELDEYFSKAPDELKRRINELEKRFEENKKKAKDDPNPPINPMDLY
ncbi:MAG: hypothetical protein N2446_01505 [Elusimicrobiales bacterium]|nr:hypothetical protein [Elusimicrobiales bacterium]